ncbi:hypothetical protein [Litoribacter populi]|uniref:hypothetical protein n=1 Tax=Litoribacter populi TaxID=2598460 RepID=UPI00118130B1|nr:hypothetical protein [Litoribacter populi]
MIRKGTMGVCRGLDIAVIPVWNISEKVNSQSVTLLSGTKRRGSSNSNARKRYGNHGLMLTFIPFCLSKRMENINMAKDASTVASSGTS